MGIFGQRFNRLSVFAIIWVFIFTSSSMAIVAPIRLSATGGLDQYLGFCTTGPSTGAEINCLEGETFGIPQPAAVPLITINGLQKFAVGAGPDDEELPLIFQNVTDDFDVVIPNTYAFMLPEAWRGSRFLFKTGNLTPGNGNNQRSYVFQNLSDFAYAVFNINDPQFPLSLNGDLGKISHLTAIQVSAVPLPAGIWMLLSVLGGMFGIKKLSLRSKKA